MSRLEYTPNPPPQSLTEQGTKDLALYLQNELTQISSLIGGVSASRELATAWGSFDSTPTIFDSHNISSVVKDSLGRYTVTFATTMANNDYTVVPSGGGGSGVACSVAVHSLTTTSFQISAYSQAGTLTAWAYNGFAVYGGVNV